MQRYFVNEKKDNSFILSNEDSYHIKKVMRMNVLDKLEVIYNKELYICEITTLEPVRVDIIEEKEDYNEMDKKIIICQSLVNEQKMDLILQKSTELGMYEFIPYTAYNSVVKENNKSDKKVSRWQAICKEASEQSKRNIIPKVNSIMGIKDVLNYKADLKIILSVNEKTKLIKNVLQSNKDCDTIIIVVGPEGGFDPKEEKIFIDNGFVSTSLGKRVLRTETSALSVLSMINYEWM